MATNLKLVSDTKKASLKMHVSICQYKNKISSYLQIFSVLFMPTQQKKLFYRHYNHNVTTTKMLKLLSTAQSNEVIQVSVCASLYFCINRLFCAL